MWKIEGKNTKKIMITGSSGQLGSALKFLNNNYLLAPLDKSQLDVVNKEKVFRTVKQIKPDYIIHTAAYTKVDESEIYIKKAIQVNCIGTENIALACKKFNAVMVYISTDYIFDGKKGMPYTEQDMPSPVNIYGYTKFIGEQIVRSVLNKYIVVRSSWLYGGQGKNFVNTILELAKKNSEIRVVDDQIGCPTYVMDLAEAIFQLIKAEVYGVYHASNSGYCSWYQFAREILKCTGNKDTLLIPVTSKELNRLARRPANSSLINTKGVYQLREWKDALYEYIQRHTAVNEDIMFNI
ncbi:MAG: dTDP-4-dehydrorhamnose reductase [Petroclostridium sp.]|jgi:dTDP-4-dehydrorhamnose reductase|nr:dTDP-4-dehydrorhamnose reductase [Petroclostridium sp.]